MLTEEDLKSIAKLVSTTVDEKLKESESRLENRLKTYMNGEFKKELKEEIRKEIKKEISESEARMAGLMEAHFDPKFNLLSNQFQLVQEKLVSHETLEEAKEDVDDDITLVNKRVDLVEKLAKQNEKEIKELKKAL